MPRIVDDLSRALVAFDRNSTLAVVVELSQSSWLVAGVLPGVDRRPLKKLEARAPDLLRLVQGWREEAELSRIVALARKLLIALWRLATTGQVPEGVRLRPAEA